MKEEKIVRDKGWWNTHLVECLRCGNRWVPKKDGKKPVVCPGCKSPYWSVPRKQKKNVVERRPDF